MGLSFRDPWARYRKSTSPAGRAKRSGLVVVNALQAALEPDVIVMADGTQIVSLMIGVARRVTTMLSR